MQSRSDLAKLAAALNGLPILGCLEGSPAAEAGLRYGDILLAVDDMATETWDDFLAARARCGKSFVARIFRDGAEQSFQIELRPVTRSPLEVLGEIVERGIVVSPDHGSPGDRD